MTTFVVLIILLILFYVIYDEVRGKYMRYERKTRLIDVRLKLHSIGNELEEMLEKGEFTSGCAEHDLFFEYVNTVRFSDSYISLPQMIMLRISKRRKKLTEERMHEFENELKKMSPKIIALSKKFMETLIEAFEVRHPVISTMLYVYILIYCNIRYYSMRMYVDRRVDDNLQSGIFYKIAKTNI